MTITCITYGNPGRVKLKITLDMDRFKPRGKSIPQKIEELNDAADRMVDGFTGMIVDFIG